MKISKKVLALTLTVALVACLNWSYLGNLWSLISSAALGMVNGQTVSTAALQSELENLTLGKLLRFNIADFSIEDSNVKDFIADFLDDIINDDDSSDDNATTEDVAFEDTTEEIDDASATEEEEKGESRKNRLALGLREYLDDFANNNNAHTYKDFPDPSNWKQGVLDAIRNPDVTILFNLDGIDNPWSAVTRASSGTGGATDWELLQIKSEPESWDKVLWYKNDEMVSNPFE